jgi:hypothetical protein
MEKLTFTHEPESLQMAIWRACDDVLAECLQTCTTLNIREAGVLMDDRIAQAALKFLARGCAVDVTARPAL